MIERERRFICSRLPDLIYDETVCIKQIYGDIDISKNMAMFNNTALKITNEGKMSLKGRGRIRHMDSQYTLDIKFGSGYEREEYSFSIIDEANASLMLSTDDRIITKNRHIARGNKYDTMIDEFNGRYRGLIVGELEGECEDEDTPPWACREITDNNELSNINLYFSNAIDMMNYYRRMLDDCQDKQA